jgi:hypothetical protein
MTSTTTGGEREDVFDRPLPIRAVTRECRLQLQECAAAPEFADYQWAENRLSDFNLWDAGVGATAGAANALDTRLKDDLAARNVVISSINTLAAWARKWKQLAESSKISAKHEVIHEQADAVAIEDEDADITLEEAEYTIELMLRILVNLGTSIRKAGTASRLGAADRTFEGHKDDYSDMIEYLTEHLQLFNWMAIAARDLIASHDTQAVQTQDAAQDQVSVPIAVEGDDRLHAPLRPEQEILITAVAKRIHRFKFHKARDEKLKISVDKESPTSDLPPPPPKTPPIPGPTLPTIPEDGNGNTAPGLTSTGGRKVFHPTPSAPPQSPSDYQAASSTNKLSKYEGAGPLQPTLENSQEAAPPTTIAFKADYPKIPPIPDGAIIFKCPYCFYSIGNEYTLPQKWR